MGNRFREKVVEEGLDTLESPASSETHEIQEDIQDLRVSPERRGNTTPRKGDRAACGIGRVLGGDILAGEWVLKQVKLVLLCLVYLLLIVGNRYRVESLSREKTATEERINYLREHRIQMQKQYQQSVKISQIAEQLKDSGVGITSGPPYEI